MNWSWDPRPKCFRLVSLLCVSLIKRRSIRTSPVFLVDGYFNLFGRLSGGNHLPASRITASDSPAADAEWFQPAVRRVNSATARTAHRCRPRRHCDRTHSPQVWPRDGRVGRIGSASAAAAFLAGHSARSFHHLEARAKGDRCERSATARVTGAAAERVPDAPDGRRCDRGVGATASALRAAIDHWPRNQRARNAATWALRWAQRTTGAAPPTGCLAPTPPAHSLWSRGGPLSSLLFC